MFFILETNLNKQVKKKHFKKWKVGNTLQCMKKQESCNVMHVMMHSAPYIWQADTVLNAVGAQKMIVVTFI